MADNFVANPGAGGDTFAADEIAGVKFPRSKLGFGADGAYADVSAANRLPVDVSFPATQPVSGSVSVSNFPATQPVSGSVSVSNFPSSQAVTSSLDSLVQTEDSPHLSAANGIMMLGVRTDAHNVNLGDNGDYVPFQVNGAGRLKVSAEPSAQDPVTGTIAANGQTVVMDTSRTSNITIHCFGTFNTVNCAFEGSLNSTNGTDGNWFAVQAIRTNANTIETTTGNLSAAPAYAWELSVNGLRWFRVRAIGFGSGTQSWIFQPAPYATEPIPGAQVSGTQPVSGTVTANIGTGSLAAGVNLIGDVSMQVRNSSAGGASIHHIVAAASTNAANVKIAAGRLYGWSLSNTTAAWVYVKLHNTNAAPAAGAGVVMTIGIPPNDYVTVTIPHGIGFTTGIGRTIVTGAADADATAVAANAVVGDLFFA